jgi:hypothetical protein
LRRDDADDLAAPRVDDAEDRPVDFAERTDALFAIVPPKIWNLEDRPIEYFAGSDKRDTVLRLISRGLGGVPTENRL